jgi:uncharacterized surface protein with fasciclin (FAS1) repeats
LWTEKEAESTEMVDSTAVKDGQQWLLKPKHCRCSSGKRRFSLLIKQAAGLVETLRRWSFTVFAPNNAAFAKLPAGTVESLLKPESLDNHRSGAMKRQRHRQPSPR